MALSRLPSSPPRRVAKARHASVAVLGVPQVPRPYSHTMATAMTRLLAALTGLALCGPRWVRGVLEAVCAVADAVAWRGR